jgi:hypothetical protein
MGKKGGKSKGFISQGIHSNVDRKLLNSMRRDRRVSGKRALNQLAAWKKGKNVVFTIPNPNPNETNRRFIRVNARDIKGKYR